MDAVFLRLLNMSITASWLCLAVLLVRLLLKKAPKAISCALWALVGLRLMLPFSLESVLSLVPSAEPLPEDMLLSPAPTINSGIPVINEVVNPVISGSLAPNPGDSVNPMQVITTIAGYLWLIGMAAMLVYMLVTYLRVRHKVAEAALVEGNIYECDHIDTPFILGVIRPHIYLPSAMEEGDRAFVIAHEQAHLRRLDHVWKPLGFVLLTVYWFNPLLWLGYILLCRDIELACDEKVIKELGTDIKKQYSEALINCSVPRRAISACPLAFGEVGVKGRIKSVLNYKKPAFWIILVAVIALIVTGVCFLTDPPHKLKDPPSGTKGPTVYDFTDIDYYEWTGEYSKEAFITAVNGYEQTGKIPVVYPDGSILRNVRISVPFAIKSCKVIFPGPVVGDAATEYQLRTYTGIATYVEGTTAYIDVSGWHRLRSEDDPVSNYAIWSYVVKLTDMEDVDHYYYFRVDYSPYGTAPSISQSQAFRRIANRELSYRYLAYTGEERLHSTPDDRLCLDLYINGRTLYFICSDGIGLSKIGRLFPVTLNKHNFDDYFSKENTLGKGPYAQDLRQNNVFAWEIKEISPAYNDVVYPMYLLVQRDGSVYCAMGSVLNGQPLFYAVYGFQPKEKVFLHGVNEYSLVWHYDVQSQISLYEFPDITFKCPGSIQMIDASGKIHSMISNPRIVYFADLNQDGYREFVAEGGDGDDDDPFYINIYDIKNKAGYVLRDFGKQYSLMVNSSMVVEVFDHINKTFIGGPKTLTLSTSDDGYILELYDNSQIWYQEEATYRD